MTDLLAVLPKPAVVLSERGEVTFANAAFDRLSAAFTNVPSLFAEIERRRPKLRAVGRSSRFDWAGEAGDARHYEVHLTRATGGQYIVLLDDVSDQTRVEEIQGVARTYLEEIVNHLTSGVAVVDRDLRLTFVNRRQRVLFDETAGVTPLVDLIGARLPDRYPIFSPDEWAAIEQEVGRGETVVRSKWPFPRDHPQRYLLVTLIPLAGGGALCMTEDMTRLVALESDLVRTERMALVGQMAITVNHEINNPLTVIVGNAESLLAADDLPADARAALEAVERAAQRISDVTRKLRELEEIHLTQYIQDGPMMVDIHRQRRPDGPQDR